MHQGADRPGRHLQYVGNVLILQMLEIPEDEHIPVSVVELLHGPEEGLLVYALVELLLRVVAAIGHPFDYLVSLSHQIAFRSGLLPPIPAARLIVGDAVDPGRTPQAVIDTVQ